MAPRTGLNDQRHELIKEKFDTASPARLGLIALRIFEVWGVTFEALGIIILALGFTFGALGITFGHFLVSVSRCVFGAASECVTFWNRFGAFCGPG